MRDRVRSILLDPHFADHKRHYLAQAGFATLVLAAVLIFQDALANAAIVTAIASSAFLVFVNPGARMAAPRPVIGGHVVALLVALLFSYLLYDSPLRLSLDAQAVRDVTAAMAVGVSILAMAVTNTEHAPAAGTVLGLVIQPWSAAAAAAVVGAAVLLTLVRLALRRSLVDLV